MFHCVCNHEVVVETSDIWRIISLFIYFCSFDPREGYCPQDVEHVIINIHYTMWYN